MRGPCLAVVVALAAGPAPAAEWGQWRGPHRDGTSGALAFAEWPARLLPLWAVPVGEGQSSPVVGDGHVFVFGREEGEEVVEACALADGRPLWRSSYPAPYRVYSGAESYGAGPKSTPVLDGGRLFTLGISGILTAHHAATGRRLWQHDFAGRFPATPPPFGTAMSPLVAGGRLIAHVGGHDGGALIAFDPATGEEAWTIGPEGPSYSSPILATLGGRFQLVIQVHRSILGVDPATGERLWSVPFVTPCDQNIVTPLVAGDFVVVSSLDHGVLGIRVQDEGGALGAEVAWRTREVSLYMSSPVLAGGRVLWTSEGGRGENGALVVMGDDVAILEEDGELLILPVGADGLAPRARYGVSEGPAYAHPVPTRAGLLVRGQGTLSLLGLAAEDLTTRR